MDDSAYATSVSGTKNEDSAYCISLNAKLITYSTVILLIDAASVVVALATQYYEYRDSSDEKLW